jgi:hypothetical protein
MCGFERRGSVDSGSQTRLQSQACGDATSANLRGHRRGRPGAHRAPPGSVNDGRVLGEAHHSCELPACSRLLNTALDYVGDIIDRLRTRAAAIREEIAARERAAQEQRDANATAAREAQSLEDQESFSLWGFVLGREVRQAPSDASAE